VEKVEKVVAELCMRWRRWPQIVKDFKGSEVEAMAASEGSGETVAASSEEAT